MITNILASSAKLGTLTNPGKRFELGKWTLTCKDNEKLFIMQAWKKNNGIDLIALSIGRKRGAMTAFGWSWGGFIPTYIKSKDLMMGMTRGQLGVK